MRIYPCFANEKKKRKKKRMVNKEDFRDNNVYLFFIRNLRRSDDSMFNKTLNIN